MNTQNKNTPLFGAHVSPYLHPRDCDCEFCKTIAPYAEHKRNVVPVRPARARNHQHTELFIYLLAAALLLAIALRW